MGRTKGSVTVFISIIFLAVVLLVSMLTESVRVYAASNYGKGLTYICVESVFAEYARQVLDEYGVLLLWEQNQFEDTLSNYIDINNKKSDINSAQFDTYGLQLHDIKLVDIEYATDNGGDDFVQQILKYEKYEIAADAVDAMLAYLQTFDKEHMDANGGDISGEGTKYFTLLQEQQQKLEDIAQKTNEMAKIIIDSDFKLTGDDFISNIDEILLGESKEKIDATENSNIIKIFKKLKKELGNINDDLKATIKDTQDYKNIKTDIENSIAETYTGEDYIENNIECFVKIHEIIDDILNNYIERFLTENSRSTIYSKEVIDKQYKEPLDKCLGELIKVSKEIKICDSTLDNGEGKNILENAKTFLDRGLLGLAVPMDMEISTQAISKEGIPSNNIKKSVEQPLNSPINKVLFINYLNSNFGNAASVHKGNALKYELEYIIAGQSSDKENLQVCVEKIILIRQIFNTLTLMADGEKRALCSSTASSASLAIGLPFLQPLFEAVLIEAWALAESVSDVKELLGGGEVPIYKSSLQWKTDLSNLSGEVMESDEQKVTTMLSPDYDMYLMFLLYLNNDETITYRAMDLVECNIAKKYNSQFDLSRCITSVDVKVSYEIQNILPKSIVGQTGAYKIDTFYKYGYLE